MSSEIPESEEPSTPKRIFWTPEVIAKCEKALSEPDSPEGKKLKEYLRRGEETARLVYREIAETERITAEDLQRIIY